jgi:3-hydroxyisobutyrate dehydrogenase-like beta-hydroxyacid dehydrogenase
MGDPIARNLLLKLGPITVWNRTAAKAQALEGLGASIAATPRAAAMEVTLTVLPDLPQVEALLHGDTGLLAGWRDRGTDSPVLVVHGTVSPVAASTLASRLFEEHGLRLIDAPLSGGTVGAEAGALSIMVGGDAATVGTVMPLFEQYGKVIRYLGPSGSGEIAKACNQIVVAATVTAVSEAMLLARASGLDLEVVRELLQGGLARNQVLEQKGEKWLAEEFSAGGSAKNQLKDLRFIHDAADAANLCLPVTDVVETLFARMIDEGDGELDHTGIYRTIARGSA